ncbi:hypothetical protein E2C01_053458 [Portunus trituberculatus]|uniref:Uncharacterized protein n=1 Tax=Portunus trituberculatus TaxID=210409 RepID=A0A5B7GP88_PORTR|nr:hypothetical protein [Portunus trituberculatus]
MVNAVESVICQVPSNVKGKKMNDPKITEDCNQKRSSSESELFIPIVAILIIIILLGLLVQVTFRKIRQESIGIFWVPPPRNDATHGRTHSVCIVHAWQDNEMVKADLVDPLTNLGYSVLWNESPYFPGDSISDEAWPFTLYCIFDFHRLYHICH